MSTWRRLVSVSAIAVSCCASLAADAPESSPVPAVVTNLGEERDLRQEIQQAWSRDPKPAGEFEAGDATLREKGDEATLNPELTVTEFGFEIQMPSGTPIATPAVVNGRLYASGGFSSREFHCFNASSGQRLWTVDLSDDGPSMAVIQDGTLLFSTESCTLFALDAESGRQLWSWYLGDPLLSAPAVAGGRVFAVYPDEPSTLDVDKPEQNPDEGAQNGKEPVDGDPSGPFTHVLVCFDLRTGEIEWQRRIDTDCMTAPIASGESLLVVTLSGRLYRFRQSDGGLLAARDLKATSVPTVAGEMMYLPRRVVLNDDSETVRECLVVGNLDGGGLSQQSLAWAAPYLDRTIQEHSDATDHANAAEEMNAIGGGFGGGFFQVPSEPTDGVSASGPVEGQAPSSDESEMPPPDLLAKTERLAADVIGLGNVSTLQSFQGSRPLVVNGRIFASLGNRIVSLAGVDRRPAWEVTIEGDMQKIGGQLATPPVLAGDSLFVATVTGRVLQLDPDTGAMQHKWNIEAPIRFSPIVEDGRLYAGTQNGRIICLELGDKRCTGWSMWGRDAAHSNSVAD